MKAVESAVAAENRGLEGDTHALPDSSRQVLLIEREVLDALALMPGQVKENFTTEGISLMTLARGDRLRVGGNVLLEITNACSPCSRMEEIRPGLRADLAGRRGMLARVISGGIVKRGDTIEVIA